METSITPVSEAAKLPLYSGVAVRVFSLLFSPVAGGILAAQNLKDCGHAYAAQKVLWVSIGGFLLFIALLYNLPLPINNSSISIGVGIGSGIALETYTKKYNEDWKQHPAKRLWKPLLICLVAFVPIIALMIFAVENPTI